MIIPKTQTEQDVDMIVSGIVASALAVSAAAQAFNNAHSALWNLSDDRLIAVLNYFGPQNFSLLCGEHFDAGTSFNKFTSAVAANLPEQMVPALVKAITVRGRDVVLNAEGKFEFADTQPAQ